MRAAGLQDSGAMFLLVVLLTRLGGLHAGPDPHKTFLQTTVPEKLSSSDSKSDPENNVAYIITIEGKPYFVHLKKQSFLSSASVVYSYDKDDSQRSKPLLVQMDCSYHGYVAGFPNSRVSLNTCSGLRGTLQFKNISYGIEPMEALSGFVHMIYKEKNDNTNIPLLGNNGTYSRNSLYEVRKSSERTKLFKSFPRYLETYIVVDKNLFDYMGSDIKAVTQKIIQIIGFVNTMLTQLKMTVIISSIEIWSNKNKISTIGSPNHILSRFLEWKSKHLLRPHHIAYFFAFKKRTSFIGATFPGKICNKKYAAGVALVAYIITIEGKPYFVHLKKQSFLSSASVVYSYDKDDSQRSKPLLVQMDCNYHGYVAGFPNSRVSLNTCSGLRGTLQFKNISYGIEPMEALSGFVHMIYKEKNDNTNIPLLGDNNTYSHNSLYEVRKSSERTKLFKSFHRNLETYIVVDKNLYPEGLSLESYTISIVQLLGFNLGLSYEDTDTCLCSGDICTMSPDAVYSEGVKDFSTCSLDDFKYFASNSGLDCLQNIVPEVPVYRQRSVCGNGVLEQGEQCDCGTPVNCTHKSCCDPRTCTKKKGKDCGSGECCTKNCKIRPIGILCRKSLDECDFTEYCNGVTGHCVPDTFARDGQSCDSGQAFCYEGRCRLHTKQCRNLIGGASRGAPFSCYDEVNSRGDRYGNCGPSYCDFPNLLCGKLVCAWPHRELITRANLSVIYTHVRDEICVSTFLNKDKYPRNSLTTVERPEDRDETFVQDGTVCGPDMFCYHYACVEVRHRIDFRACDSSRHCNNNGICNNFNHCHCKDGFVPPNCQPKKGEFGSIDDGHEIKTAKSYLEETSPTLPKHRFQLIFYISVPVLIITAALLVKWKKIKEQCYRGETETERSVSEESSSSSKSSSSESNSL
ncbi:disintegrin and metalloproteinase domain-containing protein 5-like isoform X2 [Diceros bicornis minor]|uniref:disintegrin and metalloproteinase domain-containing protein 5-like isoform X2 n=1 Tax=Diceros bicornis minor TaxID=77932 RepID=UPI0026EE9C2D|nr:disintegrin and metalloproteinase domain-containing protein 5-like isoform X2 [Diceros bicornis minor]